MESNLRSCKVCRELKSRILAGKYDAKNNKYTDESGKLWNGSVCPPCNLERVKNKMREKRSANG